MKQKMITIIGPTASGKTDLAAHLAASFIVESKPAEIISGDSRQVYKGMDIGTGKDICDYTVSVPSLSEPVKVRFQAVRTSYKTEHPKSLRPSYGKSF